VPPPPTETAERDLMGAWQLPRVRPVSWLARCEQDVQARIARELVNPCRSLTRAIPELERELEQRTAQTAPALLELPGCGVMTAAKLLAEIGPVDRFRSSGRVQRHRLDRGGNRQFNAALYRIAITQARYHPAARAYLERKQAEGKSRREAIRCLKRLLARAVFNTPLKASPTLT
jgi:transposase